MNSLAWVMEGLIGVGNVGIWGENPCGIPGMRIPMEIAINDCVEPH